MLEPLSICVSECARFYLLEISQWIADQNKCYEKGKLKSKAVSC
jgi:hypothetical protein